MPVAAGGPPLDPGNAWLLCPDCDATKTRADLADLRAGQVPADRPTSSSSSSARPRPRRSRDRRAAG